jgi:hypothetical protein
MEMGESPVHLFLGEMLAPRLSQGKEEVLVLGNLGAFWFILVGYLLFFCFCGD